MCEICIIDTCVLILGFLNLQIEDTDVDTDPDYVKSLSDVD